MDPFVVFWRHRRLFEHREDPLFVEGQVVVDLAVTAEIDGEQPLSFFDKGVGIVTAPPQEAVGDVVVVDVEPEERLALERVRLAIGVTVDGHDHTRGCDGTRRDRRDRPTGDDRPAAPARSAPC